MRTIVFDLDGTLADTAADMIAAANEALRAFGAGAPLDPAGDAATAFHGGKAMLRLGFSRAGLGDADLAPAYHEFLRVYGENLCRESRFYPGAREAVMRLKASGARVAICTNKPEALARGLVEALGADDLFDALIGADTLPTRKPDPAPLREAVTRAGGNMARAMMVGDTDNDLATARAAGVPCALVTFGPGAEAARALGAQATLDDFAALDDVVARLIG